MKPVRPDKDAIRFLRDNSPQLMAQLQLSLEASGLYVSEPNPANWSMAVGRTNPPDGKVRLYFRNFLLDVALRDRDHPHFDKKLADPQHMSQKVQLLIAQQIASTEIMLDCAEKGIEDPRAIADALWSGLTAKGLRPQRVRTNKPTEAQ